jgi:hypothetical protein
MDSGARPNPGFLYLEKSKKTDYDDRSADYDHEHEVQVTVLYARTFVKLNNWIMVKYSTFSGQYRGLRDRFAGINHHDNCQN